MRPAGKGAEAQAIGRSRGGRGTKIHVAVDQCGRPVRLIVRAGHRGDAPVAAALVGHFAPQYCVADGAYVARALRQMLLARGTLPVIPNNPTRKHSQPFHKRLYRQRNAVERTFCRLKDWRRIATRYHRPAVNYHAAVTIAAVIMFWL